MLPSTTIGGLRRDDVLCEMYALTHVLSASNGVQMLGSEFSSMVPGQEYSFVQGRTKSEIMAQLWLMAGESKVEVVHLALDDLGYER